MSEFAAPLNSEPTPKLQWIEISSTLQIPAFQIVGLPGPEVSEARERVRSAILASDLEFPRKRVVLNLSPSAVRKQGTGMDLAMALAILAAHADRPIRGRTVAWGELGLDGRVKAAAGTLRCLYAAWKERVDRIVVARDALPDALQWLKLLAQDPSIEGPPPQLIGTRSLTEAWQAVQDPTAIPPATPEKPTPKPRETEDDSALLPLPPMLERVVGVAAAGAHHLLLLGPRGAGKSHALEWIARIAPRPPLETRIQAALLAELAPVSGGWVRRVGPQVRPPALVGSLQASTLRPGEFSAAHGGWLFADEFPEWHRDSREALREPLERGWVTLTRAASGSVELPARFTLAANGNLCPCGAEPSLCRCGDEGRARYAARLSGPVLDRIDLVVRVRREKPSRENCAARLIALRKRVSDTVAASEQKFGKRCGLLPGAELEALLTRRNVEIPDLDQAASLRGRHKLIRVALTLALWDGADWPRPEHWQEASLYRAETALGV